MPCFHTTLLNNFDSNAELLNSWPDHLDIKVQVWLQASFPVRYSSLGVRSAAMLAPSAFQAFASSSFDLIHHILQETCPDFDAVLRSGIKAIFILLLRFLMMPVRSLGIFLVIKAAFNEFLESVVDGTSCAWIKVTARKELGAWIHALSMLSLGLRATDLHLGVTICTPHHRCQCGVAIDHLGIHSLSWKSQGCLLRHCSANDIVTLDCSTHLEPSGLDWSDVKHPDGAIVLP